MNRIKLSDSPKDIIAKLADGNPGAMVACIEIFKNNQEIDPESALGSLGALFALDEYKIYGTDIYVLYSDICNKKLNWVIAVLRAVQLGLLPCGTLQQACARQDRTGSSLVFPLAMYWAVKNRLLNFDLGSTEPQEESIIEK